tara:strand:+ start:327 stop:755 length:429 start_codon:yes stop_codon:yes gene_type:complete
MVVLVTGSGKNKRALVEEAAVFFKNQLMPRMKNLWIDIKLRPNYEDDGDCIWTDSYYRPREFHINLKSTNDEDHMIKTLAHEMVHVKQWAREEIKDGRDVTQALWKKTRLVDCQKTAYEDLPWEKEANKLEEILFERWKMYK